jgi:parallel beta-helix repeat protein
MKILAAATLALLASTSAFAATHIVEAGDGAQERLQEALIEAQPGDTVQIGEGRFALTDGLSLDVAGVTVQGAGADATILDFTDQQGAGEGLLVTADDVVLTGFAVENSAGDGIKSKEADRIVYRGLRVEWTGGPAETNGAYGIYPVESEDVLVENSIVSGASDAGIYVGQSDRIVVRHNIVRNNVAGIEIENSFNADVYENMVTQNTGGILVFDLPNLPQMGGHSVRVFRNMIQDNNTPNFAPAGNIVASVPAGTGVMIMANRNVHVFENAFDQNGTSNVMIVSYTQAFDDPSYNPLPRAVFLENNAHGNAGYAPDFEGGEQLATAVGGQLPPILWDGTGEAILSNDEAVVLSLGLTAAGQSVAEAQPQPVDLHTDDIPEQPEAVSLPMDMEPADQ